MQSVYSYQDSTTSAVGSASYYEIIRKENIGCSRQVDHDVKA